MFWRPFSFGPGMSGGTCPTWPFRQRFSIANVQKDCQNKKREIIYMPLENCPFLTTAYFQSLFSIWLWFLPNKERRQGGESELICGMVGIWNPECGIRNLSKGRNLESGMQNSQSFKYSPVKLFLFICRKSFHIYNNYFIF